MNAEQLAAAATAVGDNQGSEPEDFEGLHIPEDTDGSDDEGVVGEPETALEDTEEDGADSEDDGEVLPAKFKGKKASDIARMYSELEKRMGGMANELGELRKQVTKPAATPEPTPEPVRARPEDDPVYQQFLQDAYSDVLDAGFQAYDPADSSTYETYYKAKARADREYKRELAHRQEIADLRALVSAELLPSVAMREISQVIAPEDGVTADDVSATIQETLGIAPAQLRELDVESRTRLIRLAKDAAKGRKLSAPKQAAVKQAKVPPMLTGDGAPKQGASSAANAAVTRKMDELRKTSTGQRLNDANLRAWAEEELAEEIERGR